MEGVRYGVSEGGVESEVWREGVRCGGSEVWRE